MAEAKTFSTIRPTRSGPRIMEHRTSETSVRWVVYITKIGDVSDYVMLIDILHRATEQDEVVIMLNTPGGNVIAGINVVVAMLACKGKITTIAVGDCASCGSFIWSFGHTIIAGKTSRIMYHQSTHGDLDKSVAVYENAADVIKYLNVLYGMIISKGLITEAEYAKMLTEKADLNFTSVEMTARISKMPTATPAPTVA